MLKIMEVLSFMYFTIWENALALLCVINGEKQEDTTIFYYN